MTQSLADGALEALAEHYPLAPALLRHQLVGHPLLSFEGLSVARARLAPELVETKIAVAIGAPLEQAEDAGFGEAWTMLRIDRLPEYSALIERIVGEIASVVTPRTGTAHSLRGFAFVSAPDSITPFHFDPEFNLLFQLEGSKTFAVHPAKAPYVAADAHDRLHCDGDNILAWQDDFLDVSQRFELSPGDVLYVPYKSPHWVEVGDARSVSLSVTWQSAWTDAQRDAHRLARRFGRTASLPPWPATPHLQALTGRVLNKVLP